MGASQAPASRPCPQARSPDPGGSSGPRPRLAAAHGGCPRRGRRAAGALSLAHGPPGPVDAVTRAAEHPEPVPRAGLTRQLQVGILAWRQGCLAVTGMAAVGAGYAGGQARRGRGPGLGAAGPGPGQWARARLGGPRRVPRGPHRGSPPVASCSTRPCTRPRGRPENGSSIETNPG